MYKIKHYQVYILILFAFFIQILLGNFVASSGIRPNLMIIVTVFAALFTDEKFGCRTGAICGIALDIFSIRFFGLNTILFASAGYIVGKYNIKLYKGSALTHLIVTFIVSFSVLFSLLLFLTLRNSAVSPPLGFNIFFNPSILGSSLLNSFLGIWIYAFLCRIFRLSEREL